MERNYKVVLRADGEEIAEFDLENVELDFLQRKGEEYIETLNIVGRKPSITTTKGQGASHTLTSEYVFPRKRNIYYNASRHKQHTSVTTKVE
jgi:hypothetical protein